MRKIVFGLLASACAWSAQAPGLLDGRYEWEHTVLDVETGADVKVVDFLEIEHTEPAAISFVYESIHTNGHACRLYGTAREREKGLYEWVDEEAPADREEKCTAHIYVEDQYAVIADVGGYCRHDHCGARGQINVDHFPLASRKPLKGHVRAPW